MNPDPLLYQVFESLDKTGDGRRNMDGLRLLRDRVALIECGGSTFGVGPSGIYSDVQLSYLWR
jgi:hypothetical protein